MSEIEEGILRAKIAAVVERLRRGWDFLDLHPDRDRPGQPEHDLWMSLNEQYMENYRRLQRLTGKERP